MNYVFMASVIFHHPNLFPYYLADIIFESDSFEYTSNIASGGMFKVGFMIITVKETRIYTPHQPLVNETIADEKQVLL